MIMKSSRVLGYLKMILWNVAILSACATPVATVGDAQITPEIVSKTIDIVKESPTPKAFTEPTFAPTPVATLIPYTTPTWFRQAVVYEVLVRSFADSDGDGTGDLQGVIDRLGYIEALGANTIWLMPVYPSPSVHGYDVTDYFEINPDYGKLTDMQTLVDAAHARDMRVILDFVPSHLSKQHSLFQDAYRNPESEYSDWFVWTNDAHTTYAGFAGSREMPRFNHYNPEVVDYLAEAALFWLDLDGDGDYTDGIDGLRVDNATFPPQEFFVALRQAVKAENPDALLLGETWVHNPSDMSRFFADQFDALFDFPLYELLQGNQDINADGLLAGHGFPVLLSSFFSEQQERFPPGGIPVRFMSNHDTNRITNELASDSARLRLAAALAASLPDPVMVYYGEEIGMPGQKGGPPYWDNYRREPMDWYAVEQGEGQTMWFKPDDRWNKPNDGISVEEQVDDPDSLLSFYQQALNLRRSSPALSIGDFEILDIEVTGPGPWAFVRSFNQESVVAIFNFSTEEQEAILEGLPFGSNHVIDLLSGASYTMPESGEPFKVSLPPAAFIWLSGD
jgi:glycosidase